MCKTKKIVKRREAFTLVEMLVVIAIILAIAALAAAFAPRITDSNNLSRAVDNLEQWLLTAKMRAKRDGLATGIRFVQGPGDIPGSGFYSQVQYIQQPDPIAGGWLSANQGPTGSMVLAPTPYPNTIWLNGSLCLQTPNPNVALPATTRPNPLPSTLVPPLAALVAGQVQIYNFDATISGIPNAGQWLVQPGDVLELRDGGVYTIAGVVTSGIPAFATPYTTSGPPIWPQLGVPVTVLQLGILSPIATLYYTNPVVPATPLYINGIPWLPTNPPMVFQSPYEQSLVINPPGTMNFRIIRQPRILIGEEPLTLPNNYAVDLTATGGSNVQKGPSGNPEILFAPSGAVVGNNAANGITGFITYDTTMNPYDVNRAGLVAVQSRTGFIGAYNVGPAGNVFFFVSSSRES